MGLAVFIVGLLVVLLLGVFITFVVYGIIYMQILRKIGYAGWEGFVPYYRDWCIAGSIYSEDESWKGLLIYLPLIGTVLKVFYYIQLSESFGMPKEFAIGLFFFPLIFFLIICLNPNCQFIGSDIDYQDKYDGNII